VAERSKAWVCSRSPAGIARSNLAEGMDVCCECCVLLGKGLCDGPIPCLEESYRLWCVIVCDQMNNNPLHVTSSGRGLLEGYKKKKAIPRQSTHNIDLNKFSAENQIDLRSMLCVDCLRVYTCDFKHQRGMSHFKMRMLSNLDVWKHLILI
jgi:hypothetical protein